MLLCRSAESFEDKLCDVVESPDILYYRNKAKFTIGTDVNGNVSVGFLTKSFKDGRHVEDPIGSLNVSRVSVSIARKLEAFFRKSAFQPYNTTSHTGVWRAVIVREGTNTGDVMVIIESTPPGTAVGDHRAAASLGNKLPSEIGNVKVDETAVHSAVTVDSEFAILSNLIRDETPDETGGSYPSPVSSAEELEQKQHLYRHEIQELKKLMAAEIPVLRSNSFPEDLPASTVATVTKDPPESVQIHSAYLQEYSSISGPGKSFVNRFLSRLNAYGNTVMQMKTLHLYIFLEKHTSWSVYVI